MATIAVAIGPGDTRLTVDTASTTEAPFLFTLDSETFCCVSGAATLYWECLRGVNGSGRSSHAAGATIDEVFTELTTDKGDTPDQLKPRSPIDFSGITPAGTTGSLVTTGTTWVPFTVAGAAGGKLLMENRSNTGEFATWRMRAGAYNTTASGDGGNSIGTTTAIDASASARKAEYGNLFAVNACAQPNAFAQTTDTSNIVCALYGRVDRTAASAGRSWAAWVDTHETVRSTGSDFLMRLSHNGTVANDGVFTIYNGGRMPVLFNFEDVAGAVSTAAGATLTPTHKIAVSIGGAAPIYILAGTI